MSLKLAVFYHTLFYIGSPTRDCISGRIITQEQMKDAMICSGLLDFCSEMYVGINGGDESKSFASDLIPKKASVTFHGLQHRSELQTLLILQDWLPKHEDWYVCYFHAKGASHAPLDTFNTIWRHCMQKTVVNDWRKCVQDLDDGYETVGAHWLTPEGFPGMVGNPIWGGNFWWAKASFLSELPKLPLTSDNYYLPEAYIGTGRRPKAKDYAPHWPNLPGCAATTGTRI